MPIDFTIFPEKGIVLVQYTGVMRLQESRASAEAYMKHPDYKPGLRQLIDLGAVTDWERDYGEFLKLQAEHLAMYSTPGLSHHVVCHAPNEKTQSVAQMVLRSWEAIPNTVHSLCTTEEEALMILGLPETSFNQLFQTA